MTHARRWLLLIHQLPPRPDYLRVKVRRRLQRLGAVLFKNTVYVLPERDDTLEDFEWLRYEIVADGGDAIIGSVAMLAGVSDAEIEALFRTARDADYRRLVEEARSSGAASPDRIARLKAKLEALGRIDWFSAPGRAEAERALGELERRFEAMEVSNAPEDAVMERPAGATWVTRTGVFVDRIASAWLIRQFIDPAARFRFVAPDYRPQPGELRFDMYGGEFTHVGERCTFEVLLVRFGLRDDALRVIGEIVHDIDCKDERYGRPETAGIAAVLEGIALSTDDDDERIARGAPVFESLYGRLRRAAAR